MKQVKVIRIHQFVGTEILKPEKPPPQPKAGEFFCARQVRETLQNCHLHSKIVLQAAYFKLVKTKDDNLAPLS